MPVESVTPDTPVSYYGALRGSRRPSRSYRDQARAARAATTPADLERAEHGLVRVDSRPLPVPHRRELPQPARHVSADAVARQAAAAQEGVAPWRITERREARRAAQRAAERVAGLDYDEAVAETTGRQDQLDRAWDRLAANDPAVVLPTIEDALRDGGLPAVAVDLEGDRVTAALVLDPASELVPERRPNVTPTGRSTLKKRNKTEINRFYLDMLASCVVAVKREICAVAPGVGSVVVVACRHGGSSLECVYVGRLERDTAVGNASPLAVLQRSALLLEPPRGRTEELRAVDLTDEPALGALVSQLAETLRGGWR